MPYSLIVPTKQLHYVIMANYLAEESELLFMCMISKLSYAQLAFYWSLKSPIVLAVDNPHFVYHHWCFIFLFILFV